MSGAFGAAFIPVFSELLAHNNQERAWQLASAVLSWCAVALIVFCVICFIFARPLMWVVAPGFDGETEQTAVDLMRILLLSPVFLGLGIAAKGMLEAQHLFLYSALAPVVYGASALIGAIWFTDDFGIYAVAWAVIIGALGHFAIQLPALFRSGMQLTFILDRHVQGLNEVGRLLAIRVIGLAAFQVNFVAVNAFASHGDESHVAALNYSWQLLMLPHGVLALSLSTVIFPKLAELFNRGHKQEFQETFESGLKPLLFLTIPASAGLLLLGHVIIQLLLQRGAFDSADTDLVYRGLVWLALGLTGYGLTEVLTRVFYAMKDTRTPVATTVLTVLLNIALCWLLGTRLDIAGLAIALSLTTAAEAVIMMLFLRKRIGSIVDAEFWRWLSRVLGATLAMGVAILISLPWMQTAADQFNVREPSSILITCYAFVFYVTVFVVAAWLLRIPEMHYVGNRLTRMLPTRLRRLVVR